MKIKKIMAIKKATNTLTVSKNIRGTANYINLMIKIAYKLMIITRRLLTG